MAWDHLLHASARCLPTLDSSMMARRAGTHRLRRGWARLFNTAVVIHRSEVLGVVPKLHLPNY